MAYADMWHLLGALEHSESDLNPYYDSVFDGHQSCTGYWYWYLICITVLMATIGHFDFIYADAE